MTGGEITNQCSLLPHIPLGRDLGWPGDYALLRALMGLHGSSWGHFVISMWTVFDILNSESMSYTRRQFRINPISSWKLQFGDLMVERHFKLSVLRTRGRGYFFLINSG